MKLVTNRKELHKYVWNKASFSDLVQLWNSVIWGECWNKYLNNVYHIVYIFRKPAKKGVWSEKEVEQLRALYEEYKNLEEGLFLKYIVLTKDLCPKYT